MDAAAFQHFEDWFAPRETSESATLVFKPDGMRGLALLRGWHEARTQILIDERDVTLVLAVLISQDWNSAANRRIRVTFRKDFNGAHWLRMMNQYIESIETEGENKLKGMTSRRVKVRNLTVAMIMNDCFPAELIKEIEDWGLDVTTEFVDNRIPYVHLTVTDGDEPAFGIELYGMSGRMVLWRVERSSYVLYKSPEQVKTMLLGTLEHYLEAASSN